MRTGIGLGIARVLALAGATVVLADRDHVEAGRQAVAITAVGHRAVAVPVDLADEASITQACTHIVETVGVPWLLVNNAALQDREPLLDATASEWDRIHQVNARGAFLMTRETARAMVASQHGGRIVNIASNALRGGLIKGLVSYASSKGALAALSLATAFELAEHSITVNTVLPGAVITPGAINARGPISDGLRHGRHHSASKSRTRSAPPCSSSLHLRRDPSRIRYSPSTVDSPSAKLWCLPHLKGTPRWCRQTMAGDSPRAIWFAASVQRTLSWNGGIGLFTGKAVTGGQGGALLGLDG